MPASVQVCGEFPSAVPPVCVIVIDPVFKASSVVKAIPEDEVTLIKYEDDAGVALESTGGVESPTVKLQPLPAVATA